MTNKVILTEAGIIIINDKYEVLQSHRFEPNSEISLYSQIKNSNVSEDIKNFFDNSSNELPDSLEVNDTFKYIEYGDNPKKGIKHNKINRKSNS